MARIERSIEIKVPRNKVWEFLIDLKQWPSFFKSIKTVDWLTKQQGGVGSQTHWSIESYGQDIEWDAESTEWIENEKWAWRSISGMKNTGYWSLETIEGGTKVTLMMDYELPYSIFGKLIDKLKVEKDFIKTIEESLQEGKRVLESK